jgi:hypothetical protein
MQWVCMVCVCVWVGGWVGGLLLVPVQRPQALTRHIRNDNNKNQQVVAGISSFGFGGTNAHVVLESVPKTFDFDQGFEVRIACG